MGKRKDLSEFDKGHIVMARRLDQIISKTAALVGCSRSAVVSIFQKCSKEGTVVNWREGHGRPRLIDARGERRLARVVRSNRRATVAQIAQEGTVFSLDEAEDPGVIIAEDSNDIYILSGEQASDQLSPPASLLTLGDSSGPASWQTESLPVSLTGHESWAQVGMMDPEDAKSLDSAEGVALAEEQSENNSSNSDIVHVEREDAELLEEGGETVEEGELQSSVLSVLGSESELAAVREEAESNAEPTPTAPEPIVEPIVMEIPPPPASVEQETTHAAATASLPVPEPELQSQPVPAPVEPQSSSPPDLEPEAILEQEILPEVELKAMSPAYDFPVPAPSEVLQTKTEPQPESTDLPVLLYSGAALVAIAAVLAFGALAYRKK
ncbi:Bcl-2-like protein 13 [Anabarilius grahami]|uniref:Bcl-2-like protein 13 n=1 Tax=Anabarilius grahami TaxID=495550 RepID=A0A3N0YBL2_ANAGA|nr:Bcl-2-like protein 13 [Anabarilius grahami]